MVKLLNIELNPEQLKAANPDNDAVVSAGAGTGKTRLLAARYLLGLNPLDDSDVRDAIEHSVALTFTEKATYEMKERIFEFAFKPFIDTGDKRWFEIYRKLESAPISTIH